MDRRWQELTPDERSDTPLYLQLASRLAAAIHAGSWSAGEALPSERTLSEGVGVSRITARKAIAVLVDQGLIRCVRGAGSFITPRVSDPLSRLIDCSEMLEQRGFRLDSIWLDRGLRSANRDESMRLGLMPGASIASLRRLRCADGAVMALEHSALPVGWCRTRWPSARRCTGSGGVRAGGGTRVATLPAVNAGAEIARLMGVAPQAALLVITRIGYSTDQRAIELTDTYCRDDYYDFVAEFHK